VQKHADNNRTDGFELTPESPRCLGGKQKHIRRWRHEKPGLFNLIVELELLDYYYLRERLYQFWFLFAFFFLSWYSVQDANADRWARPVMWPVMMAA